MHLRGASWIKEAELIAEFSFPGIEPDVTYSGAELESIGIAKEGTFKQWRSQKRGPAYVKIGSRVIYTGSDVLNWLARKRVEPEAA